MTQLGQGSPPDSSWLSRATTSIKGKFQGLGTHPGSFPDHIIEKKYASYAFSCSELEANKTISKESRASSVSRKKV